MEERILIVDDDITFALMLRTWLSKRGFGVGTASSVAAARTALEAGGFSLVLSDMRLPDEDGIALLQWMAGAGVAAPVIVMTSYAEIQNAVRCMKLGARDYVAKPVNPDELLKKIREALDVPAVPAAKSASKPAPRAAGSFSEQPLNYIEGRSDAARQLYEHIRLVAPTNMSVLVNGASGTGKEHVAQLIHRESKRAGKPFVAVDCGAIPRDLAASEFFGHVKGAFTGALADKTGAFEAADGGTLFLDEVGNLGYETQVQLLRALQERRIRPVGSNREIPVDIRLVAATNEDLEAAIARGTFRADLYHRINSFTLRMPCLRQMRGDIPLFADFFLDQANRELDKRIVGFDAAAAAALAAYDWPGNLRQLKNAVMSATLLAAGEYITCRDLPAEVTGGPAEPAEAPLSLRDPASEEEQIRRALATAGGRQTARHRPQDALQQTPSLRYRIGGFPPVPFRFPDGRSTLRLWNFSTLSVPSPHFSTPSPIFSAMTFALEICLLRVLRRCGTSLELSEVRTRVRRPANERMKFNHLNFKAMKKTIVMMAALMLTAGGMVYAQQPEKQDTPQKENPTAPEQKQEPTAPEEKPDPVKPEQTPAEPESEPAEQKSEPVKTEKNASLENQSGEVVR